MNMTNVNSSELIHMVVLVSTCLLIALSALSKILEQLLTLTKSPVDQKALTTVNQVIKGLSTVVDWLAPRTSAAAVIQQTPQAVQAVTHQETTAAANAVEAEVEKVESKTQTPST